MNIGIYETVRLIGKGGMSEVYEAVNPRLGSRHAIKLYTYPKDDAGVKSRFEAEGSMLAKLSHPRIVRVTDIGENEGRPYFVMDLVLSPEGTSKSLADVGEGEADEETIGRWYDDIREGLAYIHSHGIVHRDLKLQNVLIGPDGHAVLADFGISKIFNPDNEGFAASAVKTIVNIKDGRRPVMGSLGYMAPELEMGVAATPQSDWYALGVIVYRLLTGTWCDARTDVLSALETYDRVWRRIIPKLIHSNPDGRECLSYAEEKAAARDRAALAAEEKLERVKRRARNARHFARFAVAALFLALAAVSVLSFRHLNTRSRLREVKRKLAIPTFEKVFVIPPVDNSSDSDDSPTLNDLELAQIDAWVLTHRIFDNLKAGKITYREACDSLRYVYGKVLSENEDDIWGDDYQAAGDPESLKLLFKHDIKRMSKFARRLHETVTAADSEPIVDDELADEQ